jgi:hypothetical protein
MPEHTEWEIVDTPSAPNGRKSFRQMMQAVLGRRWRWKVAGVGALAVVSLTLFAMLTGVVILFMTLFGLLSVGVAKLMQWMSGHHAGTHAGVPSAHGNPWHDSRRR